MKQFLAGIPDRDPLVPVTPPMIDPVVDTLMKIQRDMLVG